jgi:hypothetical protein
MAKIRECTSRHVLERSIRDIHAHRGVIGGKGGKIGPPGQIFNKIVKKNVLKRPKMVYPLEVLLQKL